MKLVNHVITKSTLEAGKRGDRGFVMVAAMLIMLSVMGMSIVATSRTTGASHHVRRDYHEEKVFDVADGGVDVAERWLRDVLESNSMPSQAQLDALTAPTLPGYDFTDYTITREPMLYGVELPEGPFEGMLADVQPYTVHSQARSTTSGIEKAVEVTLSQMWVNLFQYAIYYNGDLELFPRNPSTFTGRVHANGNVYLGSESSFDIIGYVTAGGHIYNTPKDPTLVFRGKARIADRRGQWHDLSYDSRSPAWEELSLEDWDGLVRDSAHGMPQLPAPILTLPVPINLVKRGVIGDDSLHRAMKFWYRAGLRIVDGAATDSAGNLITLPAGIVSNSSVWDCREGRHMEMRNINLAALWSNGLMPANGILYVSYSHADAAVRITNGMTLPTGGLAIVTDNPLYVQGNYNVINKQPAAFFCDAFNLYSSAWNDHNASRPLHTRNAISTRLNACLVAGDVPTTPGHYSGGAANLIRLHERWQASAELTYRGSLVCIWESEQATGPHNQACYTENHRNSAWDVNLLDADFWPDRSLVQQKIARASWRVAM